MDQSTRIVRWEAPVAVFAVLLLDHSPPDGVDQTEGALVRADSAVEVVVSVGWRGFRVVAASHSILHGCLLVSVGSSLLRTVNGKLNSSPDHCFRRFKNRLGHGKLV